MSRIFDPVLVNRIFLALTYFRTWVILFLFPILVLTPDIALNYIKKLYFPTPADFLCYNENSIKIIEKDVKIKQLREVVDPFKEENVNIKSLNSNKNSKAKELDKDIFNPNARYNIISVVSPSSSRENKEDLTKLKLSNNKGNKTVSESELIIKKNFDYLSGSQLSENIISDNKTKHKPSVDKKKDSVFVDDDFEIMEGKLYYVFYVYLFREKT